MTDLMQHNLRARRVRLGGAWLFGLALVASAPAALAQDTDARAQAKQEGFQPVAGAPDTEKVDASKLVVGAYAAILLGLFGFVAFTVKKQSEMAKEMAALADQLARAERKG
jgi:CcmD family protein